METETRDFEVVEKEIQGRNVMRLTLKAPEPFESVDPSVFVWIYNEKGESRPYTPLRMANQQIYHAIKIYENGPLSSYLANLNAGDKVKVSGFESKRKFAINEHGEILMICGGTGITPMFQILNYAMRRPECASNFTLLFYNTKRENIFLSEDLKALQRLDVGPHLSVKYIMTGETGPDALRSIVTAPIKEACVRSSYDFVYVCGTDGFLETVCGAKTADKRQGVLAGVLRELGFMSKSVYKF